MTDMRILTIKRDNPIIIDDGLEVIEIKFIQGREDKAKVAIQAPKEYGVFNEGDYLIIRKEVEDRSSISGDRNSDPGQHKRYLDFKGVLQDSLLYDLLNNLEFKSYKSFRREL